MMGKKIFNYDSYFEEMQLNLGELSKSRNGEKRGNVLIKKIQNDDPLIIDKTNKPVEIEKLKDENDEWVNPDDAIDSMTNNGGDYDPEEAKKYLTKGGKYRKVFKGDDGGEYQLNQFKKTQDFGSTGAGRLTRQFESIQCIYLAIMQGLPDSEMTGERERLSPNNLLEAFRKYKQIVDSVGSSLIYLSDGIEITEDLISDFALDKDWSYTFCKIPNKLWMGNDNHLNHNLIYDIYHIGSKDKNSPFKSIFERYKEFSATGNFKDINISKFCPADTFLISTIDKAVIIDEIRRSTSIDHLISIMNKYFDSRKLVPLSLKKIKRESNVTIITNNEENDPIIDFSLESIEINDRTLNGIGSRIVVSSIWKRMFKRVRKMNFDSSDTSKKMNIDGEVEGSATRHGKISFKYIKNILSPKISEYKTINLESYEDLENLGKRNLILKITRLQKDITRLSSRQGIPVKMLTKGRDINGNINRMISKIQSLQIIFILLEIRKSNLEESNQLITKFFKYALSIQTDYFTTPKYLRVI